MSITLVGVDHRHASREARAALVLDAHQVDAGLAQLATLYPDTEALVLATCARTEILLAGPHGPDAAATWHTLFAGADLDREVCAEATRRVLSGAAAVRHLLRVAAGVDSPMLGDVDVLAQLRDASARARAAGTLGPVLGQLVDLAIATGRRARATTDIAAGAPSVAAAVAAELADVAPGAEHVVVVGAGAVARAVVAALPTGTKVTVANRTVGRAIDLVGLREGARAVALHRLPEVLTRADAVVLAVAGGIALSARVALDAGLVTRGVPVIDAGAPASHEPLEGLLVVPLERLHERRDLTAARREAAVPAVEQIVEDAVASWRAIADRGAIERTIATLYEAAPELIAELADLDDPRAIERAVRRFLHGHVETLRRTASHA